MERSFVGPVNRITLGDMRTLEFFFDCSSPWTYLGFEQIQRSSEGKSIVIDWRPFLVGGVFNTVNPSVYASRENPVPAKARYYGKDLADWARYVGITIGSPPVFPVNSVKAMRGAFVAIENGLLIPFARRVFETYWGELLDISRDDVLAEIVKDVGIAPDEFFEKIGLDDYKKRLRDNTQELVDRGGFGSPTMFLDSDDMYFGNDRIPLIMAKLSRSPN
ncbi:MAG: 2-hydroxychromene-2-carboxylate isomerase [Pseudomonadota bacterium]|nr:2-hydroxychromene-2-carboxylate isomerase [Pseudomonadota bacterium]